MTELRAQRREPCDQPCQYEAVDEECPDRGEHCTEADEWNRCDGCDGDGTRWVTVGRLVADEDTDFSYIIKEETP